MTRRFLSALCLIALVWAQLWGSVHLSTAAHATCPEHGELIDVPTSGTNVAVQAGPLVAADPARDREGHDDHHCGFAVHGSGRPLVGAPLASSIAPASTPARAPAPSVFVRADRARILSVAPKSSPPALG